MKNSNILTITIFFFILFLSGAIFSETKAGKSYIELYKNNTLIASQQSTPELYKHINNGNITIETPKGSDLTVAEKNKKIYLHLSSTKVSETGDIIAKNKQNTQQVVIPYKIDYKENLKDLDITKNILQKHIQEMPLSCEISAAADIISYFTGKEVTESSLLKKLSKSHFNETAEIHWKNIYWGDPNEWFVWYIDYYSDNNIKPTQRLMTWYGVYEKPITKIFKEYWLQAYSYNIDSFPSNVSWDDLIAKIMHEFGQGKMIQLWWDRCTDPKYEDGQLEKGKLTNKLAENNINEKNFCPTFYEDRNISWNYKDKNWKIRKIKGFRWEHVFYMMWYKWTPNNPTHIIVWDTNTGRHIYPIKEWLRKWKALDYRTIIIDKK